MHQPGAELSDRSLLLFCRETARYYHCLFAAT